MLTLTCPVQLVPREDMQEMLHDHHTSISIGGKYATYDLPTTLILWAAAMLNLKT